MGAERFARLWRAGVFLALLLSPGCSRQGDDPIGGETHFLQKCGATSDVCGGFECLGEVCTWSCSDDSHCSALGAARCVAQEADVTGSAPTAGRCDVTCSIDDDCLVVSASHRCEGGFCRAGSVVSVAPGNGTSSDSDQVSPEPTTDSDPISPESTSSCETWEAGDQRVVLGDSFFATEVSLASALGEAERYRDYARLTFNALALGGRGIEDQYQLARGAGPVDTVIMAGGGADVLAGTCTELDATCPVIADAAQAARDLLDRFGTEGVARVLYVSYPDPQLPGVRERLDTLRPLLDDACLTSPVPCHFVDLRPAFEGHYDTYIQEDGINPTGAGTEAVATTLRATMESLCLTP